MVIKIVKINNWFFTFIQLKLMRLFRKFYPKRFISKFHSSKFIFSDFKYVVEINEDNFQQELLQSPVPVLVDIYADWSLDSQQLSPLLEKKIKEKKGKIKLVRINIDRQQEIAQQFQVENVPSIFGLIGNNLVSKHVGNLSENEIEKFISNILKQIKNEDEDENHESNKLNLLEQAKQYFLKGEYNNALSIYESIISNEDLKEIHLKSYTGILMCFMSSNNISEGEKIENIIKENYKEFDKEDKLILDMFEIHKLANLKTPILDLVRNVEKNPKDLDSLFEYSCVLFLNTPGMNNKEKAMELMLKIIKMDPKWENQKAKTVLTKYFDVIGEGDLVKRYRKKLALALF